MPTTPAQTIITVENTDSRASVGLLVPCSIIETMTDASIAVTAMVRTSVPKGSPTRCATASAWRRTTKTVTTMMAMMKSGKPIASPAGSEPISVWLA